MGAKAYLSLLFAKYIVAKNNSWKKNPIKYQKRILSELINRAKNTAFGKKHCFSKIKSYDDFKRMVPVRDYEGLRPYIERTLKGEGGVLWPKKPIYFCKTSGTTSGTKYIPITKESMPNHIVAARDSILCYIAETKNTSIVDGKMIFLQGSPKLTKTNGILTGRLSGIVAHHIPFYLKTNRLPSFKTNCISDWEKKLDAIVEETVSQNMSLISGIPPWVQMYYAGGFTLGKGKIKIISFQKDGSLIKKNIIYDPKAKWGSEANPKLLSGDVILVGKNNLKRANDLFTEIVKPFANILSVYGGVRVLSD